MLFTVSAIVPDISPLPGNVQGELTMTTKSFLAKSLDISGCSLSRVSVAVKAQRLLCRTVSSNDDDQPFDQITRANTDLVLRC